jgi:hypothetical protein
MKGNNLPILEIIIKKVQFKSVSIFSNQCPDKSFKWETDERGILQGFVSTHPIILLLRREGFFIIKSFD